MAVLGNPANASFGPTFKQMDIAAKSLKLSLQPFEVRAPGEFDRIFASRSLLCGPDIERREAR